MQPEIAIRRKTPHEKPADFLDTQAVAEELGVHEETVRRWIREGKIRAFQRFGKGGVYRVSKEEVDRVWNEIKTEAP